MQRTLKDNQKALRLRSDRVVAELEHRLQETVCEDARLDMALNTPVADRRYIREMEMAGNFCPSGSSTYIFYFSL